jgi:hypothetical protein
MLSHLKIFEKTTIIVEFVVVFTLQVTTISILIYGLSPKAVFFIVLEEFAWFLIRNLMKLIEISL